MCSFTAEREKTPFRRGDANDDGRVDFSDGICLLNYLFLRGPALRSGSGCLRRRSAGLAGRAGLQGLHELLSASVLRTDRPSTGCLGRSHGREAGTRGGVPAWGRDAARRRATAGQGVSPGQAWHPAKAGTPTRGGSRGGVRRYAVRLRDSSRRWREAWARTPRAPVGLNARFPLEAQDAATSPPLRIQTHDGVRFPLKLRVVTVHPESSPDAV